MYELILSINIGKPDLDIVNGKIYGILKSHVSLSHDGNYAIAQVVLEGY